MKILDFLKKECGFTENFEMPTALMARLLKDPDELFDSYIKEFKDLSFDNFTNYFQDNHSNRNDFTPSELCRLVANLSSDCCTCLDMCAGTGGLSIVLWRNNRNIKLVCEELSIYENFDLIVSNPPYSQKWDHDVNNVDDPRFMFFGYPPKQYSDYAFVIDALHRLKKAVKCSSSCLTVSCLEVQKKSQ